MSRARRLLVIAVAWALPFAWIAAALLSGPSDGTWLSSRRRHHGRALGPRVTVPASTARPRCLPGDLVQEVDGQSLADWTSAGSAPDRSVGERVTYRSGAPPRGWTASSRSRSP